MQATLDRFATEYQQYHGISDKRAREQRKELERLAVFAGKDTPQECGAADMRSYLASLVEDLHVNTVRKRHGMLSPFFTWGFEAGLVDAEQLMAIKLVRDPNGATGSSTPRPYSSKELRRFWEDLDARWPIDPRHAHWLRRFQKGYSRYARVAGMVGRLQTEAVISLALEGGLRRIEILSAKLDHIHPDNTAIVVPQRGERGNGKDHFREVPYTETARETVNRWFELRAGLGVTHDSPWIIGARNQSPAHALAPITLKSFQNIPRQVGAWEFHRFRHTCATLWLRSGMPLEKLQRMLGHATLQQTLAYAEIVSDDIGRSVAENESKFNQLTRRKR